MRRALVLCASVALGACATTPSPPTRLADSGVAPPAQWQAPASASGPVGGSWLQDLGDPTLNALVEESLTGNFDLRAAAARVRAARARARIAGAAELPSLDAGAGASRRGSGSGGRRSTVNSFDASLSAAWEPDLWNRLADGTRAAALDALGSEADHAAARLSLAASVARGWFDLAEATAQVTLADETVRNFVDNLAVVEDGFRAGLNSALDVRLERSNLANAQSQLLALRVERDVAARSLEVLIGRYPADALVSNGMLPELDTPVPAGLPAGLLSRRPDLQAASLRLAANDARLAVALKNRLPGLTLTASGGLSSDELRRLLDFDALLFSLAAQLAAPLLRGGELDAQRDLARAQTMETLASYAQAVLTAFREVESALTAEDLLARQEAALKTAVVEARAAEELALERYRSGLTDIITWLEARRRAFVSRSTLLAVSNRRLRNRIALHLALGGDFSANMDASAGVPGAAAEMLEVTSR